MIQNNNGHRLIIPAFTFPKPSQAGSKPFRPNGVGTAENSDLLYVVNVDWFLNDGHLYDYFYNPIPDEDATIAQSFLIAGDYPPNYTPAGGILYNSFLRSTCSEKRLIF